MREGEDTRAEGGSGLAKPFRGGAPPLLLEAAAPTVVEGEEKDDDEPRPAGDGVPRAAAAAEGR
jgi:hypothetical protein